MKHKPNVIPVSLRVTLAISAVGLLIYMCAGLATGYTYIPGRRGGFLLSAIPTLLIVVCASALFLASLLTIIDHYDKRPNEASYATVRENCLKAALYLFIAVPFIEITQRLLALGGYNVFPHLHGLAERYTFYSPSLNRLTPFLDPIVNNSLLIALLSLATGGLGILVDRYSSTLTRLTVALTSASMLGLSILTLAHSTQDFFSGETRRYQQHTVRALEEPAKFNAILLAGFALGGIMFTASTFALVAVITDRLKTPPFQRTPRRVKGGSKRSSNETK